MIVFQTETDVAGSTLLARQPETRGGKFRLWEVAGTAHFDVYGLILGLTDIGDGQGEIENLRGDAGPAQQTPMPGLIECALPINAGPMHWVFNAAVHWINRWVKYGTPPPIAPRLEATTAPGVDPVVFAVDAHGNALGGIRTPFVDVPIAKLAGTGNGARPPASRATSCRRRADSAPSSARPFRSPTPSSRRCTRTTGASWRAISSPA